MDAVVESLRRDRVVWPLLPVFLASGATSLVYETVWMRQLHLVFGTGSLAIATLLAAFMAGLALGGFGAARWAHRVSRPVLAYGALEATIGVYALLFPSLVRLVTPIYLGFWEAAQPSPALFGAFQFVVLGVLLLPPTACMGATLPLLARFVTTRDEHAGERVGQLYGANTIGAVVGTGLAGFVLLPEYGLATTTQMAAGANFTLAALALVLDRMGGVVVGGAPGAATRAPPELSLIAGLAGLASLTYEVAWFRLLGLNLGGSTYAFSTMLLAFLVGIGVGGWVGGGLADRAWNREGGPAGPLKVLIGLQAGTALLAWAMMYVYGELPYAYVWLYDLVERYDELFWPAQVLLSLLVVLPPTLLMGATFPFLVRAAARKAEDLGQPVGHLYGYNTLGAIGGAAFGGFVLLPALHVTGTVLFAAGVNLLAALAAGWGLMRARAMVRWKLLGGWALAAVWAIGLVAWKKPPWDPLLMTAGMYKYVSSFSDHSRAGVRSFAVDPYDLLYYAEGVATVVTVAQARGSKNIWLANNGKVDASTTVDMPTQVLVAQLPFAYRPESRNTLVIGLASGISLGSVTLQPDVTGIDVVEIEPRLVGASHYFDEHNHRPLSDGRVQLRFNDGRNHLMLSPDGAYDLIVSEPSNPWLTGVSNLFTREFFELGRSKLAEGGVWSQWVQLYGMSSSDLRTLLQTFCSVYPYVHMYSTIEDADIVLLGSEAPLELGDVAFARSLFGAESLAAQMHLIEVEGVSDLLAHYMMDRDEILLLSEDAELNTDDNMRVEYSAPRNLHRDTAEDNFRLLRPHAQVPLAGAPTLAQRLELSHAFARSKDWIRALQTLKAAERDMPGDSDVERYFVMYQARLRTELAGKEGGPERDPDSAGANLPAGQLSISPDGFEFHATDEIDLEALGFEVSADDEGAAEAAEGP